MLQPWCRVASLGDAKEAAKIVARAVIRTNVLGNVALAATKVTEIETPIRFTIPLEEAVLPVSTPRADSVATLGPMVH